MPVISRGQPASASSATYPASNADDARYSSYWVPSKLPAWLAYDLSSVPAAHRTRVMVGWFNDPITSPYDYSVISDVPYGLPRDYTIDANPAAGGGASPTTGWVTLVTVSGNTYHSRQHLIDLTGYNWVRINITASSGGMPVFNMDVQDASAGATDSWLILGDSITQDGLAHQPVDLSDGTNVSQLINASLPNYFPVFEDGGIGGTASADMAAHINTWLSVFPGRYVGLAFGTNDANGCMSPTAFYNNYVTAVQAVLAAGKVPVIPTIPASQTTSVQQCGPGLNAQIQTLYSAFPQIVHGPDLWAFFSANPSLISSDKLHPSEAGYVAMRQQWANAMINNVYTAAGAPAVTFSTSTVAFGSQTTGTTSAPTAVTLTNSGSAALSIGSIGVSGGNPADFSETNTCPIGGSTLAPGATCSISIVFTPSAAGARAAGLTLTDSAADSPQTISLTGTGVAPAPAVTVSPSSLTFGPQEVGTTSPAQTTTVTNTGAAPLTVSGIGIDGANPGDFAESDNCPNNGASLAAGGSCTISVTFDPTGGGSRAARLWLSDNAGGSPQGVALQGTGSAPALTLSPTSVTFASQTTGTTGSPASVNLTNSGTADLTISSIAVVGANAADFAETDTCPISPATLAAGASCTMSVTFTPQATGSRSAGVQISDDAPDSPQYLGLSGTGTAAAGAVTVKPGSLAFGNQQVGSTSGRQSVSVTNSGTAPLTISSIAVVGANAGDFGATSTCPTGPSRLAAGLSCTISVVFTPSTTGSRAAALQLTDDAAGSPQSVALSGTGTTPAVTLSPSSVSFGTQAVGHATGGQSVTLTNSGTAALVISGVGIAGTNAGDFAQTSNCPATLAVNATCSISITFTPSAVGSRTASLTVADNAAGSPQTVALSGSGASASSLAFDKTLGQFGQNVNSSTLRLTTSNAAVPYSRVLVFVDWYSSSGTLSSVSGGGLVWTVDVQAKDTTSYHTAIASASAPNGLPSGTVLSAAFSRSVTTGLIAGASFTGITSGSPVDGVASNLQHAAAAWTGSVKTANANDLVVGWSGIDNNTTNTSSSPNVKILDFGNTMLGEEATAEYQIDSTTGTKTVNGTWASASGATANSTVVAAYRGG